MAQGNDMAELPSPPSPRGTWVQTDRAAHEAWAYLIERSPQAAKIMHLLTARMGDHNAVVISQDTLADLARISKRTVQRALVVLAEECWIEVRQIGPQGGVNAYVINDRVAWTGSRDGIRYSLFSAAVVLSDKEQPDRNRLEGQPKLRQLPRVYPGERQLPAGDGLPPPSEPALPGLEPELPSPTGAEAQEQ